jgi:hypothetical protein
LPRPLSELALLLTHHLLREARPSSGLGFLRSSKAVTI